MYMCIYIHMYIWLCIIVYIYLLVLRVAHSGRSIIKLVGYPPPESFVSFQRELFRGPMSIRAEEFSWQPDSGAPDVPTLDIYIVTSMCVCCFTVLFFPFLSGSASACPSSVTLGGLEAWPGEGIRQWKNIWFLDKAYTCIYVPGCVDPLPPPTNVDVAPPRPPCGVGWVWNWLQTHTTWLWFE
jgi:hypothetical protein